MLKLCVVLINLGFGCPLVLLFCGLRLFGTEEYGHRIMDAIKLSVLLDLEF